MTLYNKIIKYVESQPLFSLFIVSFLSSMYRFIKYENTIRFDSIVGSVLVSTFICIIVMMVFSLYKQGKLMTKKKVEKK